MVFGVVTELYQHPKLIHYREAAYNTFSVPPPSTQLHPEEPTLTATGPLME